MKKRIWLVVVLYLPALSPAEISMGMRILNNRWQRRWVYTAAPTASIGYRWLVLEWDGTFGTYTPVKYPGAYSLQYRFSLIPSIRLTSGFFFAQAGFGVSYKFLRDEFDQNGLFYTAHSTQKIERQFRVSAGIRFPISSMIRFSLSSGYDYIDPDNLAFFASAGVSFVNLPELKRRHAVHVTTPSPSESIPVAQTSRPLAPKTVTVVKSNDPVLMEINTLIESFLLSQGVRLINWDILKMEVRKRLDQIKDPSGFSDEVWSNDILLASYASKETSLDAVIQVQLNYRYETYGISASILGGFIKWTNPANGEIVAILRYEGAPMNMVQFKKKIESDMRALLTHHLLP